MTLATAPAREVRELPLDLIDIEGNPRGEVTGLEELADSIREQGVIAPIMVRAVGERYRLVYGQRRTLASRIAGRDTIPAIVTDDPPELDLAKAIIENVQRENLNGIDEARAIQRMLDSGASQADVGRLLGRSTSWVGNRLRVLKTDAYVIEAVATGLLTVNHAIVLAAIPLRQQRIVAKRAAVEQWSLKKLEHILGPRREMPIRGPQRDADVPAVAESETATRYAKAIGLWTPKVDIRLARLLLWSLVEQDVFIQGRFGKRHPTGRRNDNWTWATVAELPAAALAAELAQVVAEVIAEYGPTAVKATVPGRAA